VGSKKFLLLNKIDRIRKDALLPMIAQFSRSGTFDQIVPISALKKDGTDRLKSLIFDYLPEGPIYYPTDQLCDQPERFLVAEIIREKLILETRQELPHATAVAIERFEEDPALVRIHASIYVERESQKAIVIGKGGHLLKQAGTAARVDIEALLNTKVHLETHVKVRAKWRDDDQVLESLGI
jgi:GTP-binding protein Era